MSFTNQKREYANARMSGLGKRESAIAAGCPEKTASQAACRLEKDPDVIAAIGRAMKVAALPAVPPPAGDPDAFAPAPADDPLEFMRKLMNDPEADPKIRLDAAKALAAFTVSKPGEKGKKEEKLEAAKGASGGKYAAGRAPSNVRAIK